MLSGFQFTEREGGSDQGKNKKRGRKEEQKESVGYVDVAHTCAQARSIINLKNVAAQRNHWRGLECC